MKNVFLLSALIFTILFTGFHTDKITTGNVIFIHPDGTGLISWNACRILYYGPDGTMNWDKMNNVGLYRSHISDALSSSSNAGGTIHAYGIKVERKAYGFKNEKIITARSGKQMSIMQEAAQAGIKTGLINSGSIVEPGTGAFVANVISREMNESIAKQIIQSGTEVILSGGEEWLLPKGSQGYHGYGKRSDNLNLIEWAKNNGYYIVYNREEMLNIPGSVTKLLGVFALKHTFNDQTEEELAESNLPNFNPLAPSLAEMTETAIIILSKNNSQFFLVVEEEGTDNFANWNNANATLQAVKRADDAIGVVLDFINVNPNTLLITAADSEAGGMELIGDPISKMVPDSCLALTDKNGAPLDGQNGTGSRPFLSAPDNTGERFPFAVAWSSFADTYGSVVCKAEGLNAELMHGTIDNTDIYKIMYATLFGKIIQ